MATNSNGTHLTQYDMTDRAVLALLVQHEDEDGWTPSDALARELWPTAMSNGDAETKGRAMRAIGSRLSWMKRYGIVVRFDGKPQPQVSKWGLTDEGVALFRGKLGAPQERALTSLQGAQMVLAIHRITEQETGPIVSTLMRRAWLHGTGARR